MLSKPEAFFAHVRTELFGGHLTAGQVAGINAILAAWGLYGDNDNEKLAYCLATPKLETDDTMAPIHEYGPVSYFAKYEPGTPIGARLGNTQRGDGFRYRGRGLCQITGRANYARVGKLIGADLIGNPDLALNLTIAARILVQGSMLGWFTGKRLGAYIDGIDEADSADLKEYVQARRVINGQDKAELIGGYAVKFERAIAAGVWKAAA